MNWKNKPMPKGMDRLEWIRDNIRSPNVQAVGLKMLDLPKPDAELFGRIILELHDMERSI